MTILMITGIFPPDIGGPASYVPAIAQALTERGHRVCVITLSDRLDHDDEAHGYRVIRIPRRQPRLYRMMKTVLTILRMGQDAEVLFVNGLALESVLANLLLNKRLVQKVVGDVAWERARTFGRSDETIDAFQTTRGSLRVQLLKQLRSFWVRQSHTVFAPSRYLQNIILGWGLDERKVRVIYNAVEAVPVAAPEKHPALQDVPADARVIVSIGRLVLWKGFDELIEVMDGIPEAQLFILGDGPRRGGLEELARRQSCRQRIHFTGHVSRPQVFEFLRRADVFVLNSTYEGLPHIVLEAMLAGVPVIATDVGGTGELVINNHNGLLVPPGSPQLLRTAITQLLNDKALRKRLQRQASETLTQFTWERLVNETEQILNDAETHA